MIDQSHFNEYFTIKAVAHGLVQGVSFRSFVLKKARKLKLKGTVCNLPTGQDVEVVAQGTREDLEEMLIYLKKGPVNAKVEKLKVEWIKPCQKYTDFKILF